MNLIPLRWPLDGIKSLLPVTEVERQSNGLLVFPWHLISQFLGASEDVSGLVGVHIEAGKRCSRRSVHHVAQKAAAYASLAFWRKRADVSAPFGPVKLFRIAFARIKHANLECAEWQMQLKKHSD